MPQKSELTVPRSKCKMMGLIVAFGQRARLHPLHKEVEAYEENNDENRYN